MLNTFQTIKNLTGTFFGVLFNFPFVVLATENPLVDSKVQADDYYTSILSSLARKFPFGSGVFSAKVRGVFKGEGEDGLLIGFPQFAGAGYDDFRFGSFIADIAQTARDFGQESIVVYDAVGAYLVYTSLDRPPVPLGFGAYTWNEASAGAADLDKLEAFTVLTGIKDRPGFSFTFDKTQEEKDRDALLLLRLFKTE